MSPGLFFYVMNTNFVFFMGHIGSKADCLYDTVMTSPAVAGVRNRQEGFNLSSIGVLESLAIEGRRHKPDARHVAHFLEDDGYVSKPLAKVGTFVFVLRDPIGSFAECTAEGVKLEAFVPVYRRRLRQMCELAREAERSLFVPYENLTNGVAAETMRRLLNLVHLTDTFRKPDCQEVRDGLHFSTCKNAYRVACGFLRSRCSLAC